MDARKETEETQKRTQFPFRCCTNEFSVKFYGEGEMVPKHFTCIV
jgi:hypothetical protein